MKAGIEIKKNGVKEPVPYTQMLLPDLIRSKGIKYSEKSSYELWKLEEKNVDVWYVMRFRAVLFRITKNEMHKYEEQILEPKLEIINNTMNSRCKNIEDIQEVSTLAE